MTTQNRSIDDIINRYNKTIILKNGKQIDSHCKSNQNCDRKPDCEPDCDARPCRPCPPEPHGPPGPRGPVGPRSPIGETGPAGGVLNYADFYALMPPDNTASVAPGTDVSFPQDGQTAEQESLETARAHLISRRLASIRSSLKCV